MKSVERPTTVEDYLQHWQRLKAQNKSATIDDLSADVKEDPAELRERLQAVASMMSFLGIERRARTRRDHRRSPLGTRGPRHPRRGHRLGLSRVARAIPTVAPNRRSIARPVAMIRATARAFESTAKSPAAAWARCSRDATLTSAATWP